LIHFYKRLHSHDVAASSETVLAGPAVKTSSRMKSPDITAGVPVYKFRGHYHCSVCERQFNQRSNALTHYKNIHTNVRKQCPYCNVSVKKLQCHIRDVHSNNTKVKCHVCGKLYKEGRLLKDHLNKVHCLDSEGNTLNKYSEKVRCRLCETEVAKMRLDRHLKEKHYLASQRFECPLCSSQVKFLFWHLRNYHKYQEKLYKCYKCENLFLNRLSIDQHLACHEEYHCHDCDKSFEKFLDFTVHLDITHNKFNESPAPKVEVTVEEQPQSHRITKYYISKENESELSEERELEQQELREETVTIYVDVAGQITDESEQSEAKTQFDMIEQERSEVAEIEWSEENGEKLFDIVVPTGDSSVMHIDVTKIKPTLSERLTERFRKSEVPRDLRDVTLPAEDEELLRRCPSPDQLLSSDLTRYQIQRKAVTSTKYESCPSRQAHLCPYCRQVLKSKYSLDSHIKVVHRKIKTVKCQICDKSFSNNSELGKHNRAVHDEDRDELVECGECGEQVKKCYLNRHRSYRHSKNNKTKICPKCGKDFKSRETMLAHVRKYHS